MGFGRSRARMGRSGRVLPLLRPFSCGCLPLERERERENDVSDMVYIILEGVFKLEKETLCGGN